jgi:hypothetical protein
VILYKGFRGQARKYCCILYRLRVHCETVRKAEKRGFQGIKRKGEKIPDEHL